MEFSLFMGCLLSVRSEREEFPINSIAIKIISMMNTSREVLDEWWWEGIKKGECPIENKIKNT